MIKKIFTFVFDTVFIVGSVYFISLPDNNKIIRHVEQIRTEIRDQDSLTSDTQEYLNKVNNIDTTKPKKIQLQYLQTLNQQYPKAVTLVMLNYLQK